MFRNTILFFRWVVRMQNSIPAGIGNNSKKRIVLILLGITILFILIFTRVMIIEVFSWGFYEKKAYEQQTRDRSISQKRGSIYDRNYKELASSASAQLVAVNPQQIKKDKKEFIANELSGILGIKKDTILNKLNKNSAYEKIIDKIEKDTGNKVLQFVKKNKLSGIMVDEDYKRYYIRGNLAAQLIGFTGADNQGIQGIEKIMDNELTGVPGKILSETDSKGVQLPFTSEKKIDAKDGYNVVLTIDETIQYYAQKALEKAIVDNKVKNGGTAIVMDPKTGDILAMVSKPDFDLNTPYNKPDIIEASTEQKEILDSWVNRSSKSVELLRETAWKNMGVSYTYEPGSTFKAVTSAMGLEENVVSEDSAVNDYTINVAGKNINCWKPNAHGNETFVQGVYNSCNPVFVKVAQDVGLDKFYRYMSSFGFRDKTRVDLPDEFVSEIHAKPTELDMAVASFGQRFKVTPLHIINAYCAIANGGNLLKPHIIKELTDSNGNVVKKYQTEIVREVISKQTSERLRNILEGVVSIGTGKNAYVRGYKVAGKTGTSETTENGRYIASFSAIAPADNPRICVLVVLDNPLGEIHSGGVCAAPVAGSIIEQTLTYLGVERRTTDKDLESNVPDVQVPEVRNMFLVDAKSKLEGEGFIVQVEGNKSAGEVFNQTPKPYSLLKKGAVVILYTEPNAKETMVKVPELRDKSVDDAISILSKNGLNIKIVGTGYASNQNFKAGTSIEKGRVVQVEFVNDIGD
jgi:stage V sporulation protein D (sporulation-specific penicillin-binding protein)